MKKIKILFTLLLITCSFQLMAQNVEKAPAKENILGVQTMVKNYEKKGIELTPDQKEQIEKLAVVQEEKMKAEIKEMNKELSKEEQKTLFKTHKQALRKSINKDILSENQMSALTEAHKNRTN